MSYMQTINPLFHLQKIFCGIIIFMSAYWGYTDSSKSNETSWKYGSAYRKYTKVRLINID